MNVACCCVLLCGVACWWVVVWCVCVCCFEFLRKNNAVRTFKTLPSVLSKRSCVCHQNARVTVRHGRFDGTHGKVSKVHKGASRADLCLSLFFPLSFSLSRRSLFFLSLVGSLFLFSMTMTKSTRQVGSLCTHSFDLP